MNIKTDKSFKYDYEKLDPASEEFTFLKKTIMTTSFLMMGYIKAKRFHIYKVNERNLVKTAVKQINNLMLYHGTSQKGATGILKEGFRNSEKGWFGKGVYMTDCSETALSYSLSADYDCSISFIFVNEVLKSEKMQTFEYYLTNIKHISTKPNNLFEKHIPKSRLRPTEIDYMVDFKGRRYVKTQVEYMHDKYIAEASISIPRYLIVLEKK